MPNEGDSVIITSDRAKLPPDVQTLVDEGSPLPSGWQFYETKMTMGSILFYLILGGALVLLGLGALLFSLETLIWTSKHATVYNSGLHWKPLFFGIGVIFGGGWMLYTVPGKFRLLQSQGAGKATRFGIYLAPGRLVSHSDFDTTVLPKSEFRGLDGKSVKYVLNGQDKSFNLPAEIVGRPVTDLHQAVQNWGAGA